MSLDVTYQRQRREPSSFKWNKGAVLIGALVIVNLAVFIYYGDPRERMPKGRPAAEAPKRHAEVAPENAPVQAFSALRGVRTAGEVQRVTTVGLRSGQTVAQALMGAGVSSNDANLAISSLGKLVDFRRMRPGHSMKARFDAAGGLVSLDVHRGPIDQVRAQRTANGFDATRLDVNVETTQTVVRGTVSSSLWEALTSAHEDPRLAMDIAEIFAWEIDFYTEIHPGDSFEVLVDKRSVDGRFVEYGPITAAEFTTAGQAHRAFLHKSDDGTLSYFDEEGQSLRKQLLKSPLKYAHVTSGFGSRVHPILGYTRAHNGIDYGVPIGTAVWSVGDGRVVQAGWNGGYGRYVEVRHANGWSSEYAHLSQVNVRAGQHVSQKDIVGLVGSSGMSTGPHLHYGLRLNGKFVDPSRQKFERAQPLSGGELARFKNEITQALGRMKAAAVREDAAGPRQEG